MNQTSTQNYLIALTQRVATNENAKYTNCAVGRPITINRRNQFQTANISSVLTGKNIVIRDKGDGTALIENPQPLDQTSTPNFRMVKIADIPNEPSDVVTKKYVDELLGGTIPISNAILSADVQSEQTHYVNNEEVCANGLYFPTIGGIQTKLDFYEEGAFGISWKGIWENNVSSTFVYQRIGKWVSLMFPYVSNRANKTGTITNTAETYLPRRLRPMYDISIDINGNDNMYDIPVKVTVYGDDGRILIKPKNMAEYSGAGISGFNTFSISYMVKSEL